VLFWNSGTGLVAASGAGAWGLAPPASYIQYAFDQGFGASISQTVSLSPGAYSLSYYAAARPYYRQTRFLVYHDNRVIWHGYVNRTWGHYNLTTFQVTASQTTIEFANEVPTGPSFDMANFVAGVILTTSNFVNI
jgi:hypothetical protein